MAKRAQEPHASGVMKFTILVDIHYCRLGLSDLCSEIEKAQFLKKN